MNTKGKVLKVLWTSEGVHYRLNYKPAVCVEVYGNDGSYIRLTSTNGQFFSYWIPVPSSGSGPVKWVEQTCSTHHPPPTNVGGCGLLLSKVVGRCEELMRSACELIQPDSSERCWDVCLLPPWPANPTLLLESEVAKNRVDGVGVFKAASSGRVRVDFLDGVSLESYCPCIDTRRKGLVSSASGSQLTSNVCELSLVSGHSSLVSTCDLHNWYVCASAEWCKWLSLPVEGKIPFKFDVVTREDIVHKEIERIKSVLLD